MKASLHGCVVKVVLSVLLVCICSSTTHAQDARSVRELRKVFSGMVCFGDSLSDTGNLFSVVGLPGKPYFKGRISNGIVWLEYLAKKLKLKKSFTNYAFAGATTGRENVNDVPGLFQFPGLLDQIDSFEASLGGQPADPDALYIVWAGSNDVVEYGPAQQTVDDGVANTIDAVQRLYSYGARYILVVNVADVGLAPFGQSVDAEAFSMFVDVYNSALDASLDLLADGGIDTFRLDSARILRDVVDCPDCYRLRNVTDAVLDSGGPARRSLFWDSLHPTTRGHKIFSDAALRVLIDGLVSEDDEVIGMLHQPQRLQSVVVWNQPVSIEQRDNRFVELAYRKRFRDRCVETMTCRV